MLSIAENGTTTQAMKDGSLGGTERFVAVESDELAGVMGHLVFSTVPDAPLPHERMKAAWKAEGLDPGLLPRKPSAIATFQAAVRALETRRAESEARLEIAVGQVMHNEQEVVSQVTYLVRDKGHKVIEHRKALRLTLDRATEAIHAEALAGASEAVFDTEGNEITLPDPLGLAGRVRAQFRTQRHSVSGARLRAAMRACLASLSAESLRPSGGVYFVPKRGKATLGSLQRVLRTLTGSHGEMHLIPLMDTADARELVREHFVGNTTQVVNAEVQRLRALLAARAQGAELKEREVEAAVNERRRIAQLKAEYQVILREELAELDEGLNVLDAQIARLITPAGQEAAAAA